MKRPFRRTAACLLFAAVAAAQNQYPGAADLERILIEAVEKDRIPGAVVRIGRPDRVLYQKAVGWRALTPSREPMTEDTIFDAASLTKVVATTSAVMILLEQGRIRLGDPVTAYLPEFQNGVSEITIRQLLTHYSGLRPDVDLKPAWSGYDTGIRLALIDKPVAAPGEKFIYSDINFLLLGEIVRRLAGQPLPDFVRDRVFAPLGMKDTTFQPPAERRGRIAPTEKEEGMSEPLRGIVHDPTTRFMDGIAGHAGMFTTAEDLARFASMMLRGGEIDGVRIAAPATVALFTRPHSPDGQREIRGLGWDIDSRYSAPRGDLFPVGSFGHTGFTGTSLWMDPVSKTYVILLTNSVHPVRRPTISSLRARVANIAASHAGVVFPATVLDPGRGVRTGNVRTGLEVLAETNFASLKGKRVGLITNQTGIDHRGRRNIDLMLRAGVNLTALFSPEHGIQGNKDTEHIDDSRDAKTGIPVYSLYRGSARAPSADKLSGIDVLVFDIQDIGVRFYTYMSTLLNAMEQAAKLGLPVMVLDRPNPLTGGHVEGPVLDPEHRSFVGVHELPLRHGMTIGELAMLFNDQRKMNVKLEVVKVTGWERSDWFDSTGLPWVDPSPNMRNMTAALLYAGVAMLEYSKTLSVGRGTDTPFEVVGAPWVNGVDLARYLNGRNIPGIRAYPVRFRPRTAMLANQLCRGVRLLIVDRDKVNAGRLGIELAAALMKLYPGRIDIRANSRLIANNAVLGGLEQGVVVESILTGQLPALGRFLDVRSGYLLY